MHPDTIQALAEERRKDLARAAARSLPRVARDPREPGRIRQAAARPFIRIALALLGDDADELRVRREQGRREATC